MLSSIISVEVLYYLGSDSLTCRAKEESYLVVPFFMEIRRVISKVGVVRSSTVPILTARRPDVTIDRIDISKPHKVYAWEAFWTLQRDTNEDTKTYLARLRGIHILGIEQC